MNIIINIHYYYKNNSTAKAMQIEANLLGHLLPAHFLLPKHNKKMFDLESEGQSHGVQHSQWLYVMPNINLNKSHT